MKKVIVILFLFSSVCHGQIILPRPAALQQLCYKIADDVYVDCQGQNYVRIISNIGSRPVFFNHTSPNPHDTLYAGLLTSPGLFQLNVFYNNTTLSPSDHLYLYCHSVVPQANCSSLLPIARVVSGSTSLKDIDTKLENFKKGIATLLNDTLNLLKPEILDAVASEIIPSKSPDASAVAAFFITMNEPVCLVVTDAATDTKKAFGYLNEAIADLIQKANPADTLSANSLADWLNSITANPKLYSSTVDRTTIINLLAQDLKIQNAKNTPSNETPK